MTVMQGRAVCGAITATLTGRSYAVSAEMAAELGPFDGFAANAEDMLRIIRNHRNAAHGMARDSRQIRKTSYPTSANQSCFVPRRLHQYHQCR